MHGLWHPRMRRGNYHYIHSQKQLAPPIVISVELSTTFVHMYPQCAAKNILVPYPNTDGRWFNGHFDRVAAETLRAMNLTVETSPAALVIEKEWDAQPSSSLAARPAAQFYQAGVHGTCKAARKTLEVDYQTCSPSYRTFHRDVSREYSVGMRLSTFCPAPGGDSPSAKRMFDACLAGCIPIVISKDFVWPFTKEFDPSLTVRSTEFSLRMFANEFATPRLDPKTCQEVNPSDPKALSLQARLEAISARKIQRLRRGLEKARDMYSWFKHDRELVDNPLREGILPNGGAAHAVVEALAARAGGVRWPSCQEELKQARGSDPIKFKC